MGEDKEMDNKEQYKHKLLIIKVKKISDLLARLYKQEEDFLTRFQKKK